MDESILNDPAWEQLNADSKELMAEKKGISFVSAIRQVAKQQPDRVPNQDLLERAIELIEKNDELSIMGALLLIAEEEKIALLHTKEEDVKKYDQQSLERYTKAEELSRKEGISYSEALKRLDQQPEIIEEYSLDEKEKKERTERDKLALEVKMYQANNPEDKRNFTELFMYFLDLKQDGINLVKSKE